MVGWWDFRNLLRFGGGELEERLILGSRPTISDGDKGFVKTLFYTCEVVCTLLPFVPSAFVCILGRLPENGAKGSMYGWRGP